MLRFPPRPDGGVSLKLETTQAGLTFSRNDLLRWLYLGRIAVVTGILVGALVQWFGGAVVEQTFLATVMFVVAAAASVAAFWYTHVQGVEPGENFLYLQVILDVLLVTGIVHITGGDESTFSPLYILVISEGALLLPLPGGVLIGGLASILYIADISWFFELGGHVPYQIFLFTLVAFATGFLGDRLRRAGIALYEVESQLRQLRLDTSDILDNVTTGVLTVDGRGRLAYVNPAGEALLGLDGDQWLGALVLDTVEQVAPGMGRLLRKSIEDGTPMNRFKTRTSRAGEDLVLGVSTAVLQREEGEAPSATAIFQDITELERIEALNRRTERLKAVAELSASLAHEIKNPLASIRSAVEQLTKPRLGGDDREVLERLVLEQSDRLSRLLSEFLEFSGIQMGRIETVDVARLVEDCVVLARQHPQPGESAEIRCEGLDEPLRIPGDADLLHRAVFNLVLNALQFAPEGSDIWVCLDRAPEALPQEVMHVPAAVRLTVRDSGPGVPGDEVDRIFDPFYTTRVGGSGLGLAVVHRAVRAHDGAVFVENRPEGGADFVIYLPGASVEKVEESRA